jgi:hypothetical protein
MRNTFATLATLLLFTTTCFAQHHDLAAPAGVPHEVALPYPHPTIPLETVWVGVMLMIISGMFLAAMVIGPYVRSEAPEEVPVAHSHDEPPGASHHHGPGGTVQPGPEHDLPGGHAHGGHH